MHGAGTPGARARMGKQAVTGANHLLVRLLHFLVFELFDHGLGFLGIEFLHVGVRAQMSRSRPRMQALPPGASRSASTRSRGATHATPLYRGVEQTDGRQVNFLALLGRPVVRISQLAPLGEIRVIDCDALDLLHLLGRCRRRTPRSEHAL
jgi:hypothetical protein